MTSSLIASAMLRDSLCHIKCLTAPSYTKYLISSGIRLSRMLTDRGTEFCGTQSHEYELYLAVEFYRVAFRKKIYRAIEELQDDLDAWLLDYNERRPHQGRWCFGKTPMQTFLDGLPLAKEKLMAA